MRRFVMVALLVSVLVGAMLALYPGGIPPWRCCPVVAGHYDCNDCHGNMLRVAP